MKTLLIEVLIVALAVTLITAFFVKDKQSGGEAMQKFQEMIHVAVPELEDKVQINEDGTMEVENGTEKALEQIEEGE